MPVHISTKSFHIIYLNINIYTVYTHTLFPRCCLPLALQPNIWMSDSWHPGYLVDGLNGPGHGQPCWIGNSNYRWRQKLTGSLGASQRLNAMKPADSWTQGTDSSLSCHHRQKDLSGFLFQEGFWSHILNVGE